METGNTVPSKGYCLDCLTDIYLVFWYAFEMEQVEEFLASLNQLNLKLHKRFEDLYWVSHMGDHSVDRKFAAAQAERDAFRANPKYPEKISEFLKKVSPNSKKRLQNWLLYFSCYQMPKNTLVITDQIAKLENKIQQKRIRLAKQKEGYVDPYTKKFIKASALQLSFITAINPDEKVRKAAFEAREKLATLFIKEYIQLIGLRNKFAQTLGYDDFYAYKLGRDERMTKKELFGLFSKIYSKTKYAFADVRALEKTMPGLRKPWNFNYLMAGDFRKEEDPYFQFSEALILWGKSFVALGIDFRGGKLTLDLLDRPGKWNNGFCQGSKLVNYKKTKRQPGSANFTCTLVLGQIGAGWEGYHTLFHEGGHAAHFLNMDQTENCLNSEYPPATSPWAEAQSMFLDSVFSSTEWRTRYAKNKKGQAYPFSIFERKVRKLHALSPLDLHSVMMVSNFERSIYEAKNLTTKEVIKIAKRVYRKYTDRSFDSVSLLNVPHIYQTESSASYHGYGLAMLAVNQWRAYFYKKYGYIVDNKNIGKEITKVWVLGSSKTFKEYVKIATGKELSADAWLEAATSSIQKVLTKAKKRIARMQKVKKYSGKINLNASVVLVDGKNKIADNSKGFEAMAKSYALWLNKK
jgi:oligoendopeptidase F